MRTKKIVVYAFALGMIALLLVKPEVYTKSVFNGLILFAVSVLPGMFPFFFYGKILTLSGFGDDFSAVLGKPFSKVYRTDKTSAYVFVMSLLSGYPVGARMLADFYENSLLDTDECKKISTFTSTGGPIFIVGTVGAGLFGDKRIGYVILAAHVLSALLNGLVYRGKRAAEKPHPKKPAKSPDNVLSESINSAVLSVLTVGGYVALMGMAADALSNLKILDALSAPFGLISETAAGIFRSVVISAVEMTRGCLEIEKTAASLPLKIALASFAVSFGGLSVTLQSITFLSKCKIKAGFYLLSKTTQGLIGFLIGFAAGYLFFGI
mgnify:CR=1 FL=1